ncbi:E1 ubiquitin-activating protein [Starmerella bacillaris]|uniref:Ubiquitin-activating enzyme E1-like n=1 Tax=Starmerella bacillaris TaxID=1247836 RepID=A0AAV5RGV0_STABA|nr:E1 ubiquitin-activating protein [Starmerella bacillaris]
MSSRYAGLRELLGEEALNKVRTSKVLLVGAGGIGCELVKDLVLAGFGEIHMIDLDTIDLSNLNRQFLFNRKHVKQSKAEVAAEVASGFNPDVHIVPYVENVITSPTFSVKFFQSFQIVFNALDNAEARRHVNKMCVTTGVPLIDCGSAGFEGQVQVIIPNKSECYDCRSHPTPKSFPVCTIRSTPSQPIHCVVWSKSFLFNLLFGPEQEQDPVFEGEDQENSAEKQEIADLEKESHELSDLRRSIESPDFMNRLVDKVYKADVERLLMASKMFQETGRELPKPLQVEVDQCPPVDPSSLDEHQVWSLEDSMGVLKFTVNNLITRVRNGETSGIEFDKDDDDTMNFVAAATILRSSIFNIVQESKFKLKQIAGNIIAAVATTNAIVSGFGVIEALKIAAGLSDYYRDVDIYKDAKTCVIGDKLHDKNPECVVCGTARTTLKASPSSKLEDFVNEVLKNKLGYDEVSLVADKLIYDPEFEDQLNKSLKDLNLIDKFVTVVDEDDRKVNLEIYIDGCDVDNMEIECKSVPLRTNVKRSREEEEAEDDSKRAKIDKITIDGDDGILVID